MLSEATRARLVKLLNLTGSDSDPEALTALRMVTKIIKKENLSWEQVIVVVASGPVPRPNAAAHWSGAPPRRPPPREDLYRAADDAFHHIFSGFGFDQGQGARSWIVDKRVVNALFEEAFNRGYIFTEAENNALKALQSFWGVNGRLSDKQFNVIRALVERERKRANSSSRF